MYILGISAFYHDSAAALVHDGRIAAAAQEERFTRIKQDSSFPINAVKSCLEQENITVDDLDYVVFYDKPFVKFERLLETYFGVVPKGIRSFIKAMPLWLKEKLWMPDTIRKELGYEGPVLFSEHHEAHAASAFYPSPFDEAAILTIDGVGEWSTTSFGVGNGSELTLQSEVKFPHSLGLLYSAFTYYTGFKVNSGEYKVMGLAPYGEPKYVQTILDNLIDLKDDGSFRLDMGYFNFLSGLTMTNSRFHKLLGGPPRTPETLITQREMDLARSVQVVTEEVMMRMANHVHAESGSFNLCLAGGVALNCVGNGKILRDGPFESLWIQPAAGDAGGALGAALLIWHRYKEGDRLPVPEGAKDRQFASLLGPSYSDDKVETFAEENGYPCQRLPYEEMIAKIAGHIAEESVIGWFQGRMEFGPRALGARSIIGDPRSREMQSVMNLKIKFRESFRPFAPTVLRESVADWFEMDTESPYMLLVAPVREDLRIEMTDEQKSWFGIEKLNVPRSQLPAITHVDYSARVQTVRREDNQPYYDLIRQFREISGCPVIVNTSFNVRGEPIVCSLEDAYRCFMRTDMDFLVLGNVVLDKTEQPEWTEEGDWRTEFALD